MSKRLAAVLAGGLLLAPVCGEAAPLLGTQVTGAINFGGGSTNYYNPANGFVPAGCLNTAGGTTVTIAEPAVEFCFQDAANRDTANFTDTTITLTDQVFSGAINWTQTFTNVVFLGLTFTEIADNFPTGGVTLVQIGDQLQFTWAGTGTPGTFSATYQVNRVAAPEPASAGLLLMGLAAAAARRYRKQD